MCTDFIVPQGANYTISARTMDFGPLKKGAFWAFEAVPFGTSFAAAPVPSDGSTQYTSHTWKAQCPCFGITLQTPSEASNDVAAGPLRSPFVDIMNIHGLSASALWLPPSLYPTPANAPIGAKFISALDICGWIGSTYGTVAGLKKDLDLAVSGKPTSGGFVPFFWDSSIDSNGVSRAPLHFQIHDKTGASLVLEFRPGKNGLGELVMTDNTPLGVMTNAPFLDWHQTNLQNYCCVSNQDVDSAASLTLIGDNTIKAAGHGGGFKVFSSSALPADRYIRTVFNLNYSSDYLKSLDWTSGDKTSNVISHTMNLVRSVYVIRGQCLDAATTEDPNPTTGDFTQWEVIRDHRAGIWYIKTTDCFSYWKADFTKFQLQEGAPVVSTPLSATTETTLLQF